MKRRTFLTTTTMASAGLSAFLISGCSNVTKMKDQVVADVAVAFELEEETISSIIFW
jgi:amidase